MRVLHVLHSEEGLAPVLALLGLGPAIGVIVLPNVVVGDDVTDDVVMGGARSG